MKLNATAYFQCEKGGVKMLSNTLEPDILQKNICFTQEIRPGCKVCELRYRPIGTMFFIQEYNLLFPIPKKNVNFNIYHLLFQTNIFFCATLQI